VPHAASLPVVGRATSLAGGGFRTPVFAAAAVGLTVLLSAACGSGTLADRDAEAADGSGVPDGSTDTPCGGIVCHGNEDCVEGRCIPHDACRDVVCGPGQACSGGMCVSGAQDDAGDGFPASEDCDDHDPDVVPGTTLPCHSACAEGMVACVDGRWTDCDAPTECGCTPTCSACCEVRREDCSEEWDVSCCTSEVCCGDGVCDPDLGEADVCGPGYCPRDCADAQTRSATDLAVVAQECVSGPFPWGSTGVRTTFTWVRGTGSTVVGQRLDLTIRPDEAGREGDCVSATDPPSATDARYVSEAPSPIGPLLPNTPHWWRIDTDFPCGSPRPTAWHPFSTISCGSVCTEGCQTCCQYRLDDCHIRAEGLCCGHDLCCDDGVCTREFGEDDPSSPGYCPEDC
jgi:hypothetical protein